jgi:hypothetical protein
MLILAFVGLITGFLSGFFGVGGGTITVPLLVFFGFNLKNAIGISVVQMLFGSIFGTYLNMKRGNIDIKAYFPFLIGGLFGGFSGAFLANKTSDHNLLLLFLVILILAILRVFFSPAEHHLPEKRSFLLYVLIGLFIGILSGMIGVGGAILLTPILVGFLNFSVKKAVTVSLYFVIASSASALVGLYHFRNVDLQDGTIAALFSLGGVWLGIHLASKVHANRHKSLLLFVYIVPPEKLNTSLF